MPRVPAPGPGGYLDANSYLGEWPSRPAAGSLLQSRQDLVDQRLRQMDRLGIRRAAISLLEGVWLKDSGCGNEALQRLVGDRADRFFPVYTLNPSFPAWPEHLDRCLQEYGLAPGRGAVRVRPTGESTPP